ncbi:MAG TPA: hypothetical protein VFC76_08810 [Oscillospiraceae bacterium]|nr:hypothetical protein [Oscillospiraceae bacterium]
MLNGSALSVPRAIWSFICAIMLIVSGFLPAAEPVGAELVETQTFVMTEALTRAQGMTTDGEYYYFSSNFFLIKTTLSGEVVLKNLMAIPTDLLLKGLNHIGGCSYYDGKIYAAVEDGSDYLTPYIVIYDAETLKYTGEKYLLPQELHVDGVPWCAVDSEKGFLYTAEWSHAVQLNVFDLDTMEFIKGIPLIDEHSNTVDIHRVQGSEVYGGKLYCSTDTKDDQPVLSVDLETGVVREVFSRNLGDDAEAEGMTILIEGDDFYIITMDIGRINGVPINVNIRKYAIY